MIEKIKSWALIIVTIIAVILFGLYMHKSDELDIAAHNVLALNDTIHNVKMVNGELLQYKKSLILSLNELQEYTNIKKAEVVELQYKLDSKLRYIAKLEGDAVIEHITTKTDSVVVVDSTTHQYHFYADTKYYSIDGTNTVNFNKGVSSTVIDTLRIPVDLTVGLTKEDWTIFVKSSNPYIQFNTITGANLSKSEYVKKNRFSIALGADFGVQYNLIHRTFDVGPSIGLQFNWIIWSF